MKGDKQLKKITLIITLLNIFAIINAQTDENINLDSVSIQKNEIIMPQEIIEMVVSQVKNEPVKYFLRYGIENKEQLEDLQLGRPVPVYIIDSDTLKLSSWRVPFMYEGKYIIIANVILEDDGQYKYSECWSSSPFGEGIHNYERKDLIGILQIKELFIEYHYLRQENKDFFVQVYDWRTRGYLKHTYSLGEVINRKNRGVELFATTRPPGLQEIFGTNFQVDNNDIFDTNFPQKHELEMTSEITEMVVTELYWRIINSSYKYCFMGEITNRTQLDTLHLGKPIPEYWIDLDNENLIFTGSWHVPVMSDGESLFMTRVSEGDGPYHFVGCLGGDTPELIHNYEYRDLIIGFITKGSIGGMDYLIIRKDNKDVFVEVYNWETRECLKSEYTFNELINLLKE
jgi:hypothetical protein